MIIDPKVFTFDALERDEMVAALRLHIEQLNRCITRRNTSLRFSRDQKRSDTLREEVDGLERRIARNEDLIKTITEGRQP